MKISYISGTDAIETDNTNSGIGRTGIEWGESINYKFSTGEKTKIRAKRVFAPFVAVRAMLIQLIEGNRGGIADILYAMSAFNKDGKVNPGLKNQHDAFMAQARKEAKDLYPFKLTIKRNGLKITSVPDNPTNFGKYSKLVLEKAKEANKKFPYLIYPKSDKRSQDRYRGIEIKWMQSGGNVDTFNKAVIEGSKKSPRSKTFNYLLGKIAAGRYTTKDLGLAVRAFVSALFGGDRFKWTDKDIFNPWAKRFGSMKISSTIGAEPVTTAAATAATLTGTQAFWLGVIKIIVGAAVAALPFLISASRQDPNIPEADVLGNDFNGGNSTGFDIQSLLIPGAIAAGAYILLSDDKK